MIFFELLPFFKFCTLQFCKCDILDAGENLIKIHLILFKILPFEYFIFSLYFLIIAIVFS